MSSVEGIGPPTHFTDHDECKRGEPLEDENLEQRAHESGKGAMGLRFRKSRDTPPRSLQGRAELLPQPNASFTRLGHLTPTPMRFYTKAGDSCRLYDVNPNKQHYRHSQEAFYSLKHILTQVEPEGRDFKLEINLDTGVFTKIYDEEGEGEESQMTGYVARNQVIDFLKTPDGFQRLFGREESSEDVRRQHAEAFFTECFTKLGISTSRIGLKTISHFLPDGPDRFGSYWAGSPFQHETHTPKIIQEKEGDSLSQEVGKHIPGSIFALRRRKNLPGVESYVANSFQGDLAQQQSAMQKVIKADTFQRKLQEGSGDFLNEIQDLQFKKKAEHVLGMLQAANKRALWVTATFIPPTEEKLLAKYEQLNTGSPFDQTEFDRWKMTAEGKKEVVDFCYESVVRDHYEDLYKDKKPDEKPSYEDFCRSTHATQYQQDAAKIASTLIDTPEEYLSYCERHNIVISGYNGNTFLNHFLREISFRQDEDEPLQVNFADFNIGITDEECGNLLRFMTTCYEEAQNEVRGLVIGQGWTGKEVLKAHSGG